MRYLDLIINKNKKFVSIKKIFKKKKNKRK